MLDFLLSSVGIIVAVVFSVGIFLLTRYKRCPSNKILVVYGKVGKGKSAKCIHGGGSFIIPIIQDWKYLTLNPITIEIDLKSALSKQNIRINTPSTFTIGISTADGIMLNAAERLLGFNETDIKDQAIDIILGQLRLVIATLSIEEINQDREQFLQLVNKYVTAELNKVGLELINVNIKDIVDESGYIEAIGKKAAAEAINKAKVEVAEQDTSGSIGEAQANREKEVQVALAQASAEEGRKSAETQKRVKLADLETEATIGEKKAHKRKEIDIANQESETEQGRKLAESARRVKIASIEADTIKNENEAKAEIASYNATLTEEESKARERAEVARAVSQVHILEQEQEQEKAALEKTLIIPKEIDKRQIVIEAEAKAAEIKAIAQGEADAELLRYQAEAKGLEKILQAKADGYREMVKACNDNNQTVTTLLLIEKLEALVAKQTEAISNLKIDKITVWDSGQEGGSTSNFIKNFISTLPPIHDLANQVGIDLPQYLGNMKGKDLPIEKEEVQKLEE